MPSPRPGFSILITSAPRSPSSDVHQGPAAWWLRSITRMPVSAPCRPFFSVIGRSLPARRAAGQPWCVKLAPARGAGRVARVATTTVPSSRRDLRDDRLLDPDTFVAAVPHDTFRRLRAEDPVSWQRETPERGFWAVTRHADVVQASLHPEL